MVYGMYIIYVIIYDLEGGLVYLAFKEGRKYWFLKGKLTISLNKEQSFLIKSVATS